MGILRPRFERNDELSQTKVQEVSQAAGDSLSIPIVQLASTLP